MISIIIPTFNCAKYLQEALQSILNQSDTDYEVILVDDGSIDNTREVIRPYLSNIQYIYQENRGPASARNNGIKAARGEYIAFLDGDDRWYPFKLEMQKKCLDQFKDIGLVFSDFSAFRENQILYHSYVYHAFTFFKENRSRLPEILKDEVPIAYIFEDAARFHLTHAKLYSGMAFDALMLGNFILPSTVLLRKKELERSGLFNEGYRCAEDPDFFLRFSRWNKIGFIDACTMEYRLHNESQLSGKRNTEKLIQNTLDSLLTLANSEPELYRSKKGLFCNALSRTANRLAYYYLSECNMEKAVAYAKKSAEFDRLQYRSYMIYLLAKLPPFVVEKLKELKENLKNLRSF